MQLVFRPIRCATRWTSIHSSASSLPSQITARTSGWKISAPPPGRLPSPAATKRRSVSSIEIFSRLANQPISIAVKAFRCAFGKRSFSPRSISSYQAIEQVGVEPPTMWNSVTSLPPCSAAFAQTSSSDICQACGSSFIAAKLQNLQL